MKSADLKKKSDKDLQKMLIENKEKIREYTFGASGAAKGISPKNIRKDIARILTEVSARANQPKQ